MGPSAVCWLSASNAGSTTRDGHRPIPNRSARCADSASAVDVRGCDSVAFDLIQLRVMIDPAVGSLLHLDVAAQQPRSADLARLGLLRVA